MTSQFMNDLYRDLLSNSPQTVMMDLPPEMGEGRISQVVTKQGAIFSDWQMNYLSDVHVQGVNQENYLQIIFCMKKGVCWNIENERVYLDQGEACIYRGQGKMERLCYAGNTDFLFKSIKLPVPYLLRLLEDYFESSEISAYQDKLLHDLSKVTITPYMEHIFAELKDFPQYRGGLGYLFLESKISELLAVYLSEVLEARILPSSPVNISKTDRDSILEARRILDSHLAFAPGLEDLARQVQMSTSKLTKGFSSMFGTSVHAYIIDQRLKKAAALLLESDWNVSQVAALVGYSKPSNFSAAFKKKYGVLPKDYRKQNNLY